MMRAVSGLPGGGKTYYMVTKIIEELRFTERFIVTNCEELNLPRIREYLQQLEPDREIPIDLDARLLVIPKPETFRFYRYRSGGLVLPMPKEHDENGRRLSREKFLAGMVDYFKPIAERPEWGVPVSYFIVEAHDYFNAQDWQEVGRAAQYYTTKHRHLHDEIILETQLIEQCDASMRRLIEQTHDIENHYQRSFGPFANRGCFKRRVYFKQKTPSSIPYETTEFKLDAKGIGSCYHTTGALGLLDRGKEAKGFGRVRKLPWWTMWGAGGLAAVALFLAVSYVPHLFGTMLGSFLDGTTNAMADQIVRQEPTPKRPALATPPPSPDLRREIPAAPAPGARFSESVRVTGFARRGQSIIITLSDGRIYTQDDPELGPDSGARVDRAGVTIEGVRYPFAKPMPSAPAYRPASPVQAAPTPKPSETPPYVDAPSEDGSAWYLAPDGTYRLKRAETRSTAFKPSFSFQD